MIVEDELNMVYDLGSLSFYDSNPKTEEQLRDINQLKKALKYDLAKLKSLLVSYKNEQQIDQEVRPLVAKIIDFGKGNTQSILLR